MVGKLMRAVAKPGPGFSGLAGSFRVGQASKTQGEGLSVYCGFGYNMLG